MQIRVKDVIVTVNIGDRAALLAAAGSRFESGHGFALATLNLDHLVKLSDSAAFRAAYQAQDLITADGNPIVWLSRLAGQPVALLPGSDLILPLVRLAVEQGLPVALIGGTDASLATAVAALQTKVSGLIAGPCIAPPMGFDPESDVATAILHQITALGPCLCLLALGAPKQETLATRGRALAPQAGFVSIGAGLDFLAGTQRRAPVWVRAIAMEWLWRLLSDPRRLALRYLRCAIILPGLAIQACRSRPR